MVRLNYKESLLFAAFFAAVGILVYLPILKGSVPLPAFVITQFAPWQSSNIVVARPATAPEYADSVTFFYPWRFFQGSALHEGELPLWNPHILSGTPFLGTMQSGLFYPLNAMFYILPTPLAWTLKLLANIVLAGVFTAMFVRAIGGSVAGAIASGLVYATAGNLTTWQGSSVTDGAIWLPLLLLGAHHLYEAESKAGAIVLTATAAVMPVFAGHPDTIVHVIFAGVAYALWQACLLARGRTRVVGTAAFALAGLLALGLAAIQIIPTMEWIGQTSRSLDFRWPAVKLHQALALFSRDIASHPNTSGLWMPEHALYAGGLTWILLPLAFLRKHRRQAVFFLVMILIGFGFVFEGPVHGLGQQIPVYNSLKTWRFLIVINFGLSVLAGLAVTELADSLESLRKSRIVMGMLTAWTVLGMAFVWMLESSRQSPTHWLAGPASSAVFVLCGYCLLMLRTNNFLGTRAFAVGAIALLSIDLISFAYGYFPFTSRQSIYPTAPSIEFLKQRNPSQERVLNLGAAPINFEQMYGLSGVTGFDLDLKRFRKFLQGITDAGRTSISIGGVTGSPDRRLDLLNARFFLAIAGHESSEGLASRPDRFSKVFSEGSVDIYENKLALPRSFLVSASGEGILVLENEEDQLKRVSDPSFQPERQVILGASIPEFNRRADAASADSRSHVEWVKSSSNRIQLRTEAAARTVLVLSQIFYPGWRAFIDDAEAPVLRVNYALTGVALPPGDHKVEFVYRPDSFRIGSMISAASLAVLTLIAALSRRTK